MPDPRAHADHDPELVAAYAAGDAAGEGLAAAAALVARCAECAQLHRDLRALAAALGSAPAPARPRDFRLTAAQAAAARRPSGLRRLLAPLAGRGSLAGPAAASLAALGVAGILLAGGLRLGAGAASLALATAAPAEAATGDAAGGGARSLSAVASGAPATSDNGGADASSSLGPKLAVPTTVPGGVVTGLPHPA